MRSAIQAVRGTKQTGITLVETLVALTVGLAVVSVAFNLYASNRTVFKQVEGVARLQESARVAAALLTADIRQAGGSLCRDDLPTTNIVNSTDWWTQPDKGIEGFASSAADSRASVTTFPRVAGDSFTVWNSNSGPVTSIFSTQPRGQFSYYPNYLDWKVNIANSSGFQAGDLIVICDFNRALIAQTVITNNGTSFNIKYNLPGYPRPGNCGPAFSASSTRVVALPKCGSDLAAYQASMPSSIQRDYTWTTGSLVGELTAHHWYIGEKASTSTTSKNNRALRRLTINYNHGGTGSFAAVPQTDEIVENVSDMQISYLVGDTSGYTDRMTYVGAGAVTDWTRVIAVRIILTLTSTEAIAVGAAGAASAATYTIPINVAIRSRLPGAVAPFR